MPNFYSSLALSYRLWFYRSTTARMDRYGPAVGLSTAHAANIFSLLLLLPIKLVPGWLFVAIPFIAGAGAYWLVSSIYRANSISPIYAKLTDAFPKFREFPVVYAYLLFTLVLFIVCLYLAIDRAA